MKPNTLSKSRFKVTLECPRKLAYVGDARYASTLEDDEFLQALADGGFQVGALAKLMHPEGVEVTARSIEDQVRETEAFLGRENVTIFEGTIRVENLVVRVDVLVKRGNKVELIEVKSKSYDRTNEKKSFRGAKGHLRSEWLPYFQDVAFQTLVVRTAKPHWTITPFLMLVDPTVACSVENLGARIRVTREGRDVTVTVDPTLSAQDLLPSLLTIEDVTADVEEILAGLVQMPNREVGFRTLVEEVSEQLAAGRDPPVTVGAQCKQCEFYCTPDERRDDWRSGWAECMAVYLGTPVDARRAETVFGLVADRSAGKRMAEGQFLLKDMDENAIEVKEERGLISATYRRRLQVQEARGDLDSRVLCKNVLREAFTSWLFPLHFIDFETARPTLPFHRGRRPNQQILFQFSHHVLNAAGRLEHRTQCLVATPGVVPNAVVIRVLRDALGGDNGTVIHWWSHERTVLDDVCQQLEASDEPDRDALVAFIEGLLTPAKGPGARLVDLGLPLVSKMAFFADTDGRSSIKKVLPAVLQQSEYLQRRYGAPAYGTQEMPSLNINSGWAWVRSKSGQVVDPYLLLDPLLSDATLNELALQAENGEEGAGEFIINGGAAMVAYSQLQQPDLAPGERARIENQLLRYCELDSLAMVMVYEALREWLV